MKMTSLNSTRKFWNCRTVSLVVPLAVASIVVAVSDDFNDVRIGFNLGSPETPIGKLNLQRDFPAPQQRNDGASESTISAGYGNTLDSFATTSLVMGGQNTTFNGGDCAVLIGFNNHSNAGNNSAAIGVSNSLVGFNAFAFGRDNYVHSWQPFWVKTSAAIGKGLYIKEQDACTVVGRYNTKYNETSTTVELAFAVGTGTGDDVADRRNSVEVFQDGNVVLGDAVTGTVTLGKRQGDVSMGIFDPSS